MKSETGKRKGFLYIYFLGASAFYCGSLFGNLPATEAAKLAY
jgi:hypothetical protein